MNRGEAVHTCMQQLSMIMVSYLILGYSCATSAQLWRNRPSANFLWSNRGSKSWPIERMRFYNTYARDEEQRVHLHDVGLVNSSDLVSPLLGGIVEGKLGDPPRLHSGDDLQTLDHAWNALKCRAGTYVSTFYQEYRLIINNNNMDNRDMKQSSGPNHCVFTGNSFHVVLQLLPVFWLQHSRASGGTLFTSCSKELYSPSVCSRMITRFRLLWRVL